MIWWPEGHSGLTRCSRRWPFHLVFLPIWFLKCLTFLSIHQLLLQSRMAFPSCFSPPFFFYTNERNESFCLSPGGIKGLFDIFSRRYLSFSILFSFFLSHMLKIEKPGRTGTPLRAPTLIYDGEEGDKWRKSRRSSFVNTLHSCCFSHRHDE